MLSPVEFINGAALFSLQGEAAYTGGGVQVA